MSNEKKQGLTPAMWRVLDDAVDGGDLNTSYQILCMLGDRRGANAMARTLLALKRRDLLQYRSQGGLEPSEEGRRASLRRRAQWTYQEDGIFHLETPSAQSGTPGRVMGRVVAERRSDGKRTNWIARGKDDQVLGASKNLREAKRIVEQAV